MSKIKVINNRDAGNLFHYAHFMCDCLLPEVVIDIHKYDSVIRQKNLHQTIGNFSKIYELVMDTKNVELLENDFNNEKCESVIVPNKKTLKEEDFQKFRSLIFNKFNIENKNIDKKYPEVILIKRGARKKLINDNYLQNKMFTLPNNEKNLKLSSGKERREINNIDKLQNYLKNSCASFESLYLEELDFESQVKYFYHAKVIIAAHGAGLSNMLFCKPETIVLEVTCGCNWFYFDKISSTLNLKHYKLQINNFESIKNAFHLITTKENIKLK